MRFIRDLNWDTAKLLKRIYKESKHHQVRQRAHCILLSNSGVTIAKLMDILGVSRKTIYNWMTAWEDEGLLGLYNQRGRGRKETFNEEQKQKIKEWVKEFPNNLKKVLIKIQEEWGIIVSKDTITRLLRSLNMTWRRMKRGLAKQPDPLEYEQKKQELEIMKQQEERGEIDIRFLDQSGFCLTPYVPYGWQEKGETIEIKSCRSRRLNVLGLLSRKNELLAYVFEGRITSEVVISCIDQFVETLEKKTIIVMDNASYHTSKKIKEKEEEWRQKNLEIFYLSTYSPQLNLIEILWKFMKYEWIEIDAYQCWDNLVNYVEKVIREFGEEYVINFA
ncbi:MAG: IS630 family transposase [Aphanizomenon flos-aquae KM1D3_PB]|uniref:IS630 family transposase n=2 Tax=Aphanizomenon flos-aquae TaxID=1176 RepID=UPI0005437769|nr:IS630 family transposase [Aphanizomenon flos-aquae]KHG39270.1 transposase [Aphanizomenon flos-aquae 2012/KM1/D3]QSV70550.1 MAG: IS630 family transposase [Aphanizomenon flos-aquae KM1D3_PB]QSV71358.1 MAG: IS630 family transposase [Aphanizomenon flos-aquae KM1D3_PB]